jgi:hypothetical protein
MSESVLAIGAGAIGVFNKPLLHGMPVNAIRERIEHSRSAFGHEAKMQLLREGYVSPSGCELQVMTLVASQSRQRCAGARSESGSAPRAVRDWREVQS